MKDTPLVRSKNLEKKYNIREIYLKNETVQPTGSHKDRETEKIMEEITKKGIRDVGIASTGNAAISLSAFCSINKVNCHVFLPKNISTNQLELIRSFNPQIKKVGENYSQTYEISNKEIEKKGYFNANPGICKLKLDGDVEIGKEISDVNPTVVICPTNNGTHICGVWKGLKESGRKPMMISSISRESKVATSIRGFAKREGSLLDRAVAESNGKIVEVSDEDIKEAMGDIAKEKIFCEPSAAASVAALKRLDLKYDNVVVCTITGTILKFPELMKDF